MRERYYLLISKNGNFCNLIHMLIADVNASKTSQIPEVDLNIPQYFYGSMP